MGGTLYLPIVRSTRHEHLAHTWCSLAQPMHIIFQQSTQESPLIILKKKINIWQIENLRRIIHKQGINNQPINQVFKRTSAQIVISLPNISLGTPLTVHNFPNRNSITINLMKLPPKRRAKNTILQVQREACIFRIFVSNRSVLYSERKLQLFLITALIGPLLPAIIHLQNISEFNTNWAYLKQNSMRVVCVCVVWRGNRR